MDKCNDAIISNEIISSGLSVDVTLILKYFVYVIEIMNTNYNIDYLLTIRLGALKVNISISSGATISRAQSELR